MKTKICNKHDCKAGGALQTMDNFRVIEACKGGYSHVCKACVSAGRNYTPSSNDVECLGNDHFIINFVKYKIGRLGFLYYRVSGEWRKSANNVDWLKRTVRRFENAQN